jgi:hypothetical protein
MGWRFVKQPNGLLALFSEVVDSFTVLDMTPAEAADEAEGKGMTRAAAWAKVGRGIDDVDPRTEGRVQGGEGLNRWRECLEIIREVHGEKEAAEVEWGLARMG